MRAVPWRWLCGAAMLLGLALRAFQLGSQVPAEDELPSLWMLLHLRYPGRISSDFAASSMPELLIGRLVAETLGLTELSYRLEPFAFGAAILVVGPWLAWRHFGPPTATIFAALLAISPLLVHYSRFARAYAAPTLLVLVGAFAYQRWLERGRTRAAWTYALSAACAVWFHPLAAPAALAPPLAAMGVALVRGRGRSLAGLRGSAWMAAGTALLMVLVLAGPDGYGLLRLSSRAGGGFQANPETLVGAMRHLAGTGSTWLAAVAWVGMLAGAIVALRRRAELAASLVAACVLQGLAVLRADAFLTELHWVLARYLIFVLPFLLLFLAVAIAEPGRPALRPPGRALGLGLAGALWMGLFLSGPLPAAYYRPNPFTNHYDFQVAYSGPSPGWKGSPTTPHRAYTREAPAPIPAFYRQLAAEPGEFGIVEAPADPRWQEIPFHYYQRIHRKRVRVGVTEGFIGARSHPVALDDPRVRFRSFVDLRDPEALRGDDLRYLIFHKGRPAGWFDVAALVAQYRSRLGDPVFEDATIVVFRLD